MDFAKLYKTQSQNKQMRGEFTMSKGSVHKKGTISLFDVIQASRSKRDFYKAGAVVFFLGVVRGETSKGETVKKLELEAYQEKANEVLEGICTDLAKKEGIVDVQIHHLLGEFEVSEELVYILVAGAHRRNLFPVLQEAVERFKKEAPIFKKEYLVDKEGEMKAVWISKQEMHDNEEKAERSY